MAANISFQTTSSNPRCLFFAIALWSNPRPISKGLRRIKFCRMFSGPSRSRVEPGGATPPELISTSIEGQGLSFKRAGAAFANRFFFLLLIGLIWLVPAFSEERFVYAMIVWDVLLL